MAVHLLRLTARCPTCGAPPKLRTLPTAARLLEAHDPAQVLLTYECHIRRCGARYPIRARDFHEAS